MKCSQNICHRPYSIPTVKLDAPYICRLAPSSNAIDLEWLDNGDGTQHKLYFRVRHTDEWKKMDLLEQTA